MEEKRLTPENFDRELRGSLRYGHNFEHHDLERAKGIVSDAIAHVAENANTKYGMGAQHLGMAMKFLNEKHAGWKSLPEHQKRHIEEALKGHFGITEPEQGEV